MKKYITSSIMMLLLSGGLFAQNNIQLIPAGGTVCNPQTINAHVQGNGFNVDSYLWSTGSTAASITVTESDTYTVTVTGHFGNSNNTVTLTKSGYYNVLLPPFITPLSDLWVCKGDTVRLASVSGYDAIYWNTGDVGELLEKEMNYIGTFGSPQLDTATVSYTAVVNGVCATTSGSVLLRAIRKPDGVGRFYQNKLDISPNDSIPAGLILEYLYPVSYDMKFTEVGNPANVIQYTTQPGSRRAPANILNPGSQYNVETTPVINGQTFCSGTPSLIGIASNVTNSSDRLSFNFNQEEGISTFRVFDVSGRLIMEKQAERFNQDWLENLTPQILIVQREGKTTEVKKIQLTR